MGHRTIRNERIQCMEHDVFQCRNRYQRSLELTFRRAFFVCEFYLFRYLLFNRSYKALEITVGCGHTVEGRCSHFGVCKVED